MSASSHWLCEPPASSKSVIKCNMYQNNSSFSSISNGIKMTRTPRKWFSCFFKDPCVHEKKSWKNISEKSMIFRKFPSKSDKQADFPPHRWSIRKIGTTCGATEPWKQKRRRAMTRTRERVIVAFDTISWYLDGNSKCLHWSTGRLICRGRWCQTECEC